MKNWDRRIRVAWEVLIGKKCLLTDAATKVVYVQDSGPEGKLVQLLYFEGRIIGLDNNGSLWQITADISHTFPTIQLWMDQPTVRR